MAQIFHKSFNSLSKISIVGGALVALTAVGYAALLFNRSPYVTQQGVVREQPVPFSHDHHVAGLGIDCRFCHTTVEVSAKAGIPPTKTCMGCHSQVWKDAEILEPVRESFREDKSIEWLRVHDLPDFVYFDHSIHIKKGVGCESCHGRVDRMPLMLRENTLNMEWCLECHRDPIKNLRPREAVYEMDWTTQFFEKTRAASLDANGHPQKNDLEIQRELEALQQNLAREYGVHTQVNCSICHR
ncbi:MAG: cytochrome c3 family protein [Planctomycetes bacterium]|nr:cytochrome c3 family protein [Planctomycetota bacterium]